MGLTEVGEVEAIFRYPVKSMGRAPSPGPLARGPSPGRACCKRSGISSIESRTGASVAVQRDRPTLFVCSNMGMVQVVAAVIERDGRILIGRRQPHQSLPLQWEFPGGKVETGESPAAALARELEEELGIREAAGTEITRYRFAYPGKAPIELIFYRVQSFTGEPRNLIFQEMRWEAPASLAQFDFVEGDRQFLEGFASNLCAAPPNQRHLPR